MAITFNELPFEERHRIAKEEFRNHQHERWMSTSEGARICLNVSMQLSKAKALHSEWLMKQIQ